MYKIIIGGDTVPMPSNMNLFENCNIHELIGQELEDCLKEGESFIINLETPLTDNRNPIEKTGPKLQATVKSVNGLKEMGVSLVGLANNHIMDQGINGLKDTIKSMDDADIKYVGAGNTLSEAMKPCIISMNDGSRVGVYACAESEFSIAEENIPGANPYDPLVSFDEVDNLKKECDMVIVLYHGGKEFYRYPSPLVQKICRKFVEKGADVVVCQHSHCIGCEEKYLNGIIVYGQGNFIFDNGNDEFWNTSMLVQITGGNTDEIQCDYIPLVKCDNKVRLAKGDTRTKLLDDFAKRSDEIKDVEFVKKQYEKFADEMGESYIGILRGYKFWIAVLNKLILRKNNKNWYKDSEILSIRNIIECEAHRELFLDYLKRKVKRW